MVRDKEKEAGSRRNFTENKRRSHGLKSSAFSYLQKVRVVITEPKEKSSQPSSPPDGRMGLRD